MKRTVHFLIFLMVFSACVSSRKPQTYRLDYQVDRFENTIKAYEKQDITEGIQTGQILFYGSSSWLKWTNIKTDLAPFDVVNRGFGGSTIPELIHYYSRMVPKYQPKAVFIYCGENDLSAKNIKTAEQFFASFKTLNNLIKKDLAATKVYFVSMKLSPSRRAYWSEISKGNALVKAYSKRNNIGYIDINPSLLDAKGSIRSDLYTGDSLHINQKGYDLWAIELKKVISKIN